MQLLFALRRRSARRALALLLFTPALAGVLLLANYKTAHAANPTTMNFQGKVVNSDGTNVTNGSYTFIFRLYDNSSPTIGANCNTNSQCWWEETQTSVTVTNGIFQVELGSVCAFTSACSSTHSGIDWNSNNAMYLTMKFNGDTSGSNNGFMTPVVHLTTVPYAFNADRLGGLASSGFIQNTTSPQATSNFNISGTGVAGTSLQAPMIITAAATDLALQPATGIVALNKVSTNNELRVYENAASPANYASITATSADATFKSNTGITKIGSGTGATTINSGAGAAINITGHATSVWQTDAGSLTIQGGTTLSLLSTTSSAISLDSGSTGAVNVGTGTNAKTVTIGNTTGATALTLDAGTGTISIGTSAHARTTNIATGAAAQVVIVGSQNSTSSLTLQGGSSNISLLTTGNIVIGTSDTTGTLLVLDIKTDSGDPSGTNGGLYYNSDASKFRCHENSIWKDCISSSIIYASNGSDTPVSVATTDPGVSLGSKAITVSAGDIITLEVEADIMNNSGATKTYTQRCRIGSTTIVANSDSTTLAAGTTRGTYRFVCTFYVRSTSSLRATADLFRTPTTAAGTTQTSAVRRTWNTSASNWTGSQTFALNVSTSATGATQDAIVNGWKLTHQVNNP